MKSLSIFWGCMFILHGLLGQESNQEEYTSIQPPRLYTRNFIGLGSGVNSNVGLFGVNVELGIGSQISANAGAGISTWGRKLHAEVRYYFNKDQFAGWAVGIGTTHSAGIKNFSTEMQVLPGDSTKTVKMELLPQNGYMLSLYKHWRVGKNEKNKIFLQTGLAGRFNNARIYRVIGQEILNRNSENILEILAPGGLILATGFSFGL